MTRPMPHADHRIKIRITPARFGFIVEVTQGLISGSPMWTLTRQGAAAKGRRIAQRMARGQRRRRQTQEIILDPEKL